jgi:DNA-binding transcriptional LysR family regulator
MKRDELNDLAAFAVVAGEGSFTKAAAKLGMSQSALSHAMKALEERLGVRLLSRTTRAVSPTEAGETLLRSLRPALDDISAGLVALGGMREKLSGSVRITTTKHAAKTVLMPMLPDFQDAHPDIQVEVSLDDRFVDIVAERFDAGIRFGEQVAKDMIAVRISPDARMAVVASPAYFSRYAPPITPRELAGHKCINLRLGTSGGLYAWEFEEGGRRFEVRVEGSLVFNDGDLIEAAVLADRGIGYLFEDQVAEHIACGRMIRILDDWCPPFPGHYLYYPSRRQTPPALAALIEALRLRA